MVRVASEAIPFPQWHSFSQYPSIRVRVFSRLGSVIIPIEPTSELSSLRIMAKTPSFPINTVCKTSLESSILLCGSQPALFPKVGFWQHSKSSCRSVSRKGRRRRRSVSKMVVCMGFDNLF